MSRIKLNVKEVKTFDRSNGRVGQVVVVLNDSNRKVEIDAVDAEEFDFSNIPTGEVEFEFKPVFHFQKALSKNDKQFYLNYLSVILTSCNDIEIE